MEKMDGTLYDVIPRLLAGKRTRGNKIPFGNVAARLLDCLQALHETGFLFVDVKPENFMLSKDGKTLADKVRMIDFGLIQTVKSMTGHRPNEGTSSLVGTPLYSSLNVHDGQTHSRRDDLEALGYIVGELLMKLIVAANGGDESKAQLPWCDGTSDEHIHKLKQEELTSTKSAFFAQLGSGGNATLEQIMRDYFSAVRELNYKEKPSYETLREMLLSLDVVAAKKVSSKKKPAVTRKTTKKAAAPSPATRKSTRSSTRASAKRASPQSDDDVSSDEEVQTPKIRRVIAIDDDENEYYDTKQRANTGTPDTDFVTARDDEDEVEEMDWETIASPAEAPPRLGIKILFTQGPHQGESFSLIKKEMETVYLGSRPTVNDGDGFALTGDKHVDDTHTKLVLSATKRIQSVLVTDLRSSSGTYVNGSSIPARKERKVFIGDSITIGDSTMKVMPLAQENESRPKQEQAAKKPTAAAARPIDAENKAPAKNEARTGPGVCITFIDGVCEGECFYLTTNDDTTRIVLGSNPVSKSDEALCIPDPSIDATHARLELNYARKLCTVNVKDLKSSSGTFVNRSRIPSGKERKAFINDSIQIGDTVMKVKTL